MTDPIDRGADRAGSRVPAQIWSNPRVVEAATSPLFSSDECDAILGACPEEHWVEDFPRNPNSAARAKVEQPLPGGNHGWIGERIARRVAEINDEIYRFAVVGLEDPLRVNRYRADRAARFARHSDLSPRNPLRKLSFSVLVAEPDDFDGGDLAFAIGPVTAARRRGTITVFPAFLLHEVLPVTKGERITLVGWAVGPTFV